MSLLPNLKKVLKTAVIARSGIYRYHQMELPSLELSIEEAPEKKEIYNVYRPSMMLVEEKDRFSMMPLTNEHPEDFLTNENWKESIIGYTGENVIAEYDKNIEEIVLKTLVAVIDENAINDLISGKKEVSCGYYGKFKFEKGESPKGESYDIIMYGVKEDANHLALCQRARGGEIVKIIDSKGGNMAKLLTGLWRTAKKLVTGAKDADMGQFRAIVEDIVKNKTSLSDEEINKKVQSLQGIIADLPESEDKAKLSRFIEDFPKGIKEKDEPTAQKAAELMINLFEKLDTESMENVTPKPEIEKPAENTSTETNISDQSVPAQPVNPVTPPEKQDNQTIDSPITPEQMKYIANEILTFLKTELTEDCWKRKGDSDVSGDITEPNGAVDSFNNVNLTLEEKNDPIEDWMKRKKKGGK